MCQSIRDVCRVNAECWGWVLDYVCQGPALIGTLDGVEVEKAIVPWEKTEGEISVQSLGNVRPNHHGNGNGVSPQWEWLGSKLQQDYQRMSLWQPWLWRQRQSPGRYGDRWGDYTLRRVN